VNKIEIYVKIYFVHGCDKFMPKLFWVLHLEIVKNVIIPSFWY